MTYFPQSCAQCGTVLATSMDAHPIDTTVVEEATEHMRWFCDEHCPVCDSPAPPAGEGEGLQSTIREPSSDSPSPPSRGAR